MAKPCNYCFLTIGPHFSVFLALRADNLVPGAAHLSSQQVFVQETHGSGDVILLARLQQRKIKSSQSNQPLYTLITKGF